MHTNGRAPPPIFRGDLSLWLVEGVELVHTHRVTADRQGVAFVVGEDEAAGVERRLRDVGWVSVRRVLWREDDESE